MGIAKNPYLPLYEYIPDGEPRVFGDRVYVYGSHDIAGGELGFCPGDYVAWSAPLSDLSDWRYEGVIYRRAECPEVKEMDALFAPDVVQGCDGRYYLYLNLREQMECRVAVSDSPAGPFENYGPIVKPDGTVYRDWKMFDPGVVVDGDKVYLYVGFCMPGDGPKQMTDGREVFARTSIGFLLAPDMVTILEGPFEVIPGETRARGTEFEGHAFFEASSPRLINGKFVMVYSSELSHEMAYAVSDKPFGPYKYMGALISNADLGVQGNTAPVMPHGNNHGGMVNLSGDWYMFYHRHTHAIQTCRQGCAEKLALREDGWFQQTEITSFGLNGGTAPAEGTLNACYCCHLMSPETDPNNLPITTYRQDTDPYIFEEPVGNDENRFLHYIVVHPGETAVGYKYFEFDGSCSGVRLKLRGTGTVSVAVCLDAPDGNEIGRAETGLLPEFVAVEIPFAAGNPVAGRHALYFRFAVREGLNFESLEFVKE